jgi:tRNA threonylcarbamoyladenosine biosynthesis protein TsaB
MNIITLQATYDTFEIGLFNGSTLIDSLCDHKRNICKKITTHINTLLTAHCLTLSDVKTIIVNRGPAPFTSLRIVLSTVNGIAFASSIPLLGASALEVFLSAMQTTYCEYNICILLNAFNNDLYYAFSIHNKTVIGCKPSSEVLMIMNEYFSTTDKPFLVAGNGVSLIQESLQAKQNELIINLTPYPTLPMIVNYALNTATPQSFSQEILPLYIKKVAYKESVFS